MPPNRSGPGRGPVDHRHQRALGAGAAIAGFALALAGPLPASAATVTPLIDDTFTSTSAQSGWVLTPSTAPVGQTPYTNGACLTAGTDTSTTPIPGCDLTTPDADGEGTLRLTPATAGTSGTVFSDTAMSTAGGFEVSFDTYQYGGRGADDFAMILAVADPQDPAPPATTAQAGSYVSSAEPGVPAGYLDFFVDNFGNSSLTNWGACPATTSLGNAIGVRGPGNGTSGYCLLDNQSVSPGTLRGSTSERPGPVSHEIVINPSADERTGSGGLVAPAGSWAMRTTPLGGDPVELTGALPSAATMTDVGIPAGWFDPDTGVPHLVTVGLTAKSAGYEDTHEVSNFRMSQLPMSLELNPSSVPQENSVTLSMAGVPAGATGTITFTSNGSTLCTATLPAVSCETAVTLPLGDHDVTADYSGDESNPAQSDTATLTVTTRACLLEDKTLAAGESWSSTTGPLGTPYHLTMGTDGNAVVYAGDGMPIWQTHTAGNPGATLVMQGDGNLVVYSATGQGLWAAFPEGAPVGCATLAVQNDGNVVIYSPGSPPYALWNTSPDKFVPQPPAATGSSITQAHSLRPGQSITVGEHLLVMQTDGNLVRYSPTKGTWSSDTAGNPYAWAVVQTDGNFVVYNRNGSPLWANYAYGGTSVTLTADGTLVHLKGGTAIWSR
ncbi:MAG: Ig-like domain repeat protein [Actinomycetales bacterium]